LGPSCHPPSDVIEFVSILQKISRFKKLNKKNQQDKEVHRRIVFDPTRLFLSKKKLLALAKP